MASSQTEGVRDIRTVWAQQTLMLCSENLWSVCKRHISFPPWRRKREGLVKTVVFVNTHCTWDIHKSSDAEGGNQCEQITVQVTSKQYGIFTETVGMLQWKGWNKSFKYWIKCYRGVTMHPYGSVHPSND